MSDWRRRAPREPTKALPGEFVAVPIAARLAENPLVTPGDVQPSHPSMEVISTINPAAARVGDETVLLLRVAERPTLTGPLPDDAQIADLSGDDPTFSPLPTDLAREDLVGLPIWTSAPIPPGADATCPGQPGSTVYPAPSQRDLRRPPADDRYTDFLTPSPTLGRSSRDGTSFETSPARGDARIAHEDYGVEEPHHRYLRCSTSPRSGIARHHYDRSPRRTSVPSSDTA